jgi:hypothetical protein
MEVGVSFSVYEITVPVMVHGLNVMDDYLDRAKALERTKEFEPGTMTGRRRSQELAGVVTACRSLSRLQSLYRQLLPSQFAQLVPRGSGREPREGLVHGARERSEARGAL